MDRLDAMRLFVRVADVGSFSAVAQQLAVARSVVTRQVAALETHLRVKLLARSTRRLSLTSAGAVYLEKCRVILNLVESAETSLTEELVVPRGRIRLSVPLSFGVRYLGPLLLEFARRCPEVTLDVDYSDRRSNLFEEGVDLAVRIAHRLEPGDVARRIGSSRLFVVAAPAYLSRHGAPRHPAELIHHECLGYTGAPNPRQWELVVDGHPQSFPIRCKLQANNGDVLLQAAIAGFGLTCAPAFIAANAMRTGQVRQVLAEFPLAELSIHAVLPSNRLVPHRIRVLMDFLADRLGPEPPWETGARPTASSTSA
jgi:DNA-binding transcriptional LysR family regulator